MTDLNERARDAARAALLRTQDFRPSGAEMVSHRQFAENDVTYALAAFARAEVVRALERAAEITCQHCGGRSGFSVKPKMLDHFPNLMHLTTGYPPRVCTAHDIRRLAAEYAEPKEKSDAD